MRIIVRPASYIQSLYYKVVYTRDDKYPSKVCRLLVGALSPVSFEPTRFPADYTSNTNKTLHYKTPKILIQITHFFLSFLTWKIQNDEHMFKQLNGEKRGTRHSTPQKGYMD